MVVDTKMVVLAPTSVTAEVASGVPGAKGSSSRKNLASTVAVVSTGGAKPKLAKLRLIALS